MRIYRQLMRTFMRSGEMDEEGQKKQKVLYSVLGIIAVLGIMLPCCLLVGYFSYAFALTLSGGSEGFLLLVHIISLFSIVFGIHVILNVFYFAGDLSFLLPLPLKPEQIIAAKFTTAYWNESFMQFLVLASAVIGFCLGSGRIAGNLLIGIVGVLTLPLAPLLYCGILCVVVMAFARFLKNKEQIRKLSVVLIVAVIVGLVSMIGLLKGINLDQFAAELAAGKSAFVQVMNVVFPMNLLFAKAMEKQSVLLLAGYLLLLAVFGCIFLGLAKILYFKGLIRIMSSKEKTVHKKISYEKACRSHSPAVAYFIKEWKILYRTPAFFFNCILVNLIWPLLFYVICIMQKNNAVLQAFIILYRIRLESMQWLVLLLVLALSALLTAMNSIAASAVTREGKNYTFMKQIPVSYEKQLQSKALLSIVNSGAVMTVYLVVVSIYLHVDNLTSYYYLLLSWLTTIFVSYFGVYLDTINPRVVWDDELNALRGNTNIFYNMAWTMFYTILLAALLSGIYLFTKLPLFWMEILIVVVLVALDGYMYRKCTKKGSRFLEKL